MPEKSIYIIAGESSGDQYGADLVKAMQSKASIKFYGYGGELMRKAGVEISRDLSHLAITGIVEVILKARTIRRNFIIAKRDIARIEPEALILIDYPGFNIRMAKWAKKRGIKVFYYIAPQTWAWKEKRNDILKKVVDRLFVILPFEADYFKKWDIPVDYVGHPLLDLTGPLKKKEDHKNVREGEIKIALFPGSRQNEVKKMTPILLEVIRKMPQCHFIVAAMQSIPEDYYTEFEGERNAELIFDQPVKIMQSADIGLIKSGTSTLQACLLNLPQIVFYKVNRISGYIMRKLAKIEYASLPNLILDQAILPELLQDDFNTENLLHELKKLLDQEERHRQKNAYKKIKKMLQKENNTANLVAESIIRNLAID